MTNRFTRVILALLLISMVFYSGCRAILPDTYSIGGRVTDGNNSGVSGVEITAVCSGKVIKSTTDSQGKYQVNGVTGEVEVNGPQISGKKTIPLKQKVATANSQVNFVMHNIQTYGEEVVLPETKIVFYDDIALDFSNTTLASTQMIVVEEASETAKEGMSAAGPVVNIESPNFSGSVTLRLTADNPGSGLFRYDPDNDLWNPVIDATYNNGEIIAELSGFSTYGVFTAPKASVPTAIPTPGSYRQGTAIELQGEKIYYTTDGKEPSGESLRYDDINPPVLEQASLIIKAFNVEPNKLPSDTRQFSYSANNEEPLVNVSGPRFVTLSGSGTYFNFDKGEVTTNSAEADIMLDAVAFGGEYTLISLESFDGTWFRPDETEVALDIEKAYEWFRSVTDSDWAADDPNDMGRLEKFDTILLKTSEGRFIKLLVLDIRGHSNHDDRPAVDFVYLFTNEVDLDPPVIEKVTLITKSGLEVSQVVSETMEFVVSEEPEMLIFDLNEPVYRNRGLMSHYPESVFGSYPWWSYASPDYYLRPSVSDQFSGTIDFSGFTPPVTIVELTAGDNEFHGDISGFEDFGYYFSDLIGNQLTELPFEKIIIRLEEK
ncbi:MAG: FN3 associated domain-containing protein [Bacillota bacterium]